MELYHIHVLGNHDKMYKEKNVIIINKDTYKNRLYDRTMNCSFSVPACDYANIVDVMNFINNYMGFGPIGNKVNLDSILSVFLSNEIIGDKIQMLKDARDILFNASQAKRELSMENYRKDNASDKPSRMHSLFACTYEGLQYWKKNLALNNCDVYRIDVLDEPFITNEQLLPPETSTYLESYNKSMRYFNPRQKDLNEKTNEILVQGKVKILEKMDEIRIK